MLSLQTKALVVMPISGDNLELSHLIVWLVRHVCFNKAEFSFLQRKTAFWCSFNRVPNWRLVCPMYSLSQSLQGIE